MDWDICHKLLVIFIFLARDCCSTTERRGLESKYGCDGELVRLHCPHSRLIQIVRANYGRLSSNICTSSSSSSSFSDCLHRSSKTVLDRICAGKSSCTVRAGTSVFPSSTCPGVEKYLEVHYRCVGLSQAGHSSRDLIPPWLEDLSATFRPLARPTTSPSSTSSSSTTTTRAPSTTSSPLSDEDSDDDENNVLSERAGPVRTGGNVTKSGGNKGRYFLIPDQSEELERDLDNSHTTLVITITISTVSTILSILIIFILCRKFRGKRLSSAERSEDNCYQCQAGDLQPPSDKLHSLPVIPVQNIIYSPVSPGEPSDYHQYRSLPFHINKMNNSMRRSRTEHTAIYGYQNKPDDNGIYHINNGTDGVYQSHNVTDGIYHIPDDFIDSSNYINHNNILHTKLYGEKGEIKILSEPKSFHPVASIPPVTTNNISLPDLSEASSLRRPASNDQKVQRMLTMSSRRPPEMLERMSPIQILFNESGQYFVNFNLDNHNK